jgi:hypothetical protein
MRRRKRRQRRRRRKRKRFEDILNTISSFYKFAIV